MVDGTVEGMRTTIDAGGRVVIPKPIRDRLGLTAGREVEIEYDDASGTVLLAPRQPEAHLELRGDLLVIVPDAPVPPLTAEQVRSVLEAGRR